MQKTIDLNSDLGEGFGAWQMGDDAAMLALVSSANIACGYHAGDPAALLDVLRAAQKNAVCVGAHVAYPDLVGFGRRQMQPSERELCADVIYQVGALQALAAAAGTRVSYVKPHGALYNTIATDRRQAEAVLAAMRLLDPAMPLVLMSGTPLERWARERGVPTVAEVFADRAYSAAGLLVPRNTPGALLHDPELIAARILRWLASGALEAVDGSSVALAGDTICVHGDSPAAVKIAQVLRARLEAAGVAIAPFVGAPSGT